MTTNPVRPPPPPDPESSKTNRADGKKFREELQKVEKVREIDPDEESRKKNKQLAAQLGDQDAPTDMASGPVSLPSPFDVNFYKTSASQEPVSRSSSTPSGRVLGPSPSIDYSTSLPPPSPAPVPSPAYSPPPTVQSTASPQPATASQPLPSSPNFWQNVDTSNNTGAAAPQNLSEYSRMPSIRIPAPQNNDSDQDNEEDYEYEYQYQPGAEPDQNNVPAEKTSPKPFSEVDQEKKAEKPKQAPEKQEKTTTKSDKKGSNETTLLSPKGEPAGQVNGEEKPAALSSETKTALPQEPSGKQSSLQTPSTKTGAQPLSETQAPMTTPTSPSPSAFPTATAPQPPSPENPAAAQSQAETSLSQGPTSPAPTTSSTSQKTDETTPMARPVGEKTAPVSSLSDTTSGQDKQDQHEQKGGGQAAAASILPQFPTDVQPAVQAAATQAASYLSPDTMALFQQMVGTIYVMNSRPGVSTTEVSLNSPAFAGSKFFGATITIEKYATAPNALNIRLSGSTDAVNAFNQNLSSLAAAFEHSKLQFTVRLETAYKIDKVDRPVFQRKGKGDEKGSQDSKDRQK